METSTKTRDETESFYTIVTVSVQTCITRFNRQFLKGIVIEDPFNLLSNGERSNSVKFINIMTIPDVVGRIEMKFECLVQIFPPWETLDDKESTLNVTYIRVVSDCQKTINCIKKT